MFLTEQSLWGILVILQIEKERCRNYLEAIFWKWSSRESADQISF